MKIKLSLLKKDTIICIGIVNNIEKSVDMIISFGIQTKWTEIRPLMGKWSEFRPAQKNQTRVATVPRAWAPRGFLNLQLLDLIFS